MAAENGRFKLSGFCGWKIICELSMYVCPGDSLFEGVEFMRRWSELLYKGLWDFCYYFKLHTCLSLTSQENGLPAEMGG